MTIKEFFSLKKNRFFWINILAMILVVCGLVFGLLHMLNVYTRHGQAIVVPDVKGKTVREAELIFKGKGLTCIVSDSIYVKEKPAGDVLEQLPASGQKVKEGRVVFLTINSLSTPLQAVPDVADNSSLRQAQARILAAGFKLTEQEEIPGEKDWVYEVKYRGRALAPNDKVPVNSTLTLVVGNGEKAPSEDELLLDSLAEGTDESWFE